MVLPGILSRLGVGKFKRLFNHGGYRKIDLDTMTEIHLSHFSLPRLKNYLRLSGFEVVGGGVDFLDPFTFKRGLVQIVRHCLFALAWFIALLSGVNVYSGLWIAARRVR
jgi:hypothetical protein